MINVVAAVIIKDNKFLITRRAPGETLEGLWEFPGGKIEKGELPEESLKRELQEELEININIKEFLEESVYEYPNVTVKLYAYLTEWLSGELKLNVHDKAEWITLEEVNNYEFAPADMPFIERLKEVM